MVRLSARGRAREITWRVGGVCGGGGGEKKKAPRQKGLGGDGGSGDPPG